MVGREELRQLRTAFVAARAGDPVALTEGSELRLGGGLTANGADTGSGFHATVKVCETRGLRRLNPRRGIRGRFFFFKRDAYLRGADLDHIAVAQVRLVYLVVVDAGTVMAVEVHEPAGRRVRLDEEMHAGIILVLVRQA